jgi:hypothetical protein
MFWSFNPTHLDFASSICLNGTCAHAHTMKVSSKWCVGQLITKALRNGQKAHFPFNLPLFGDYANTPKATKYEPTFAN